MIWVDSSALTVSCLYVMMHAPTGLIHEGDIIERIAFIQSGRCIAQALVPGARQSERVEVGEVEEGACVGEGLLRGVERQPYSITAVTSVRLGWVPAIALRGEQIYMYMNGISVHTCTCMYICV